MKFIYYSDSQVKSQSCLSDCDHGQFLLLSSEKEVFDQADAEHVVLAVLDSPPSDAFIEWRKKSTDIKIVLLTKNLSEAYLRELQNSHGFYDLFFKYPVSFFEIEKNIRIISPFSNSMWNANKDQIAESGTAKLDLSVDDSPSATIELGSLVDDVAPALPQIDPMSSIDLPKEELPNVELDGVSEAALNLTSEVENAPQENKTLPIEAPLFLSNDSSETSAQNKDLNGAELLMMDTDQIPKPANDLAHGTLSQDLKLEDSPVELQVADSLQADELGLIEDKNTGRDESEDLPGVPQTTPIEDVTLSEVLENKEDLIFRLMSKNKMLSDEVSEKEEVIKQLQKQIKDIQSQYEHNLKTVEENAFQVNVLKTNFEQEQADVKNRLETALSKVSLLESRIEELKKVPSTPKMNETVLSVGELRKLKARQEHLEEKISLLQSDSAIQLQHREKKIIDLKRKIDLLEFDLKDSQEREMELKKKIHQAEGKMMQMKQVLKQVVDENVVTEVSENPKKTGSYDV